MDSALLNPEHQFLGCLMQLPIDPVRRALTGMRPSDLADPAASFVLHLAIRAVAAAQPPTPVVLFEHAHELAARPRCSRLREIALWIANVYEVAPLAPEQHVLYLKAAVLKVAWRRAVAEYAQRLLQAVTESPSHDLRALADDTEALDELWARYEAARQQHCVVPRPEVAA
ncbi:hypothetical protein FNH05_15270 [Amycolatopsis rhizosphaerae]|uniref:DnaB-like helicase N terminal domain-containing protein n=1 Tax=Amycolatopsis rhizosphaerae TaxID=2053003 RepID=A0A558CPM2_9PSEU|nr:hypothetical protein [Amycolatopsis rhizosphaerae]TVT50724.1 hypothetical protein FNH05_15270 [Amycolatopsis rhizosphaerae]